ncbi:MAG TPA: Mur ligase family protein [Candidatus Limnocylindrales bacterium]|nr:Mur ligase family protein [Candidatus Limnocylindrales bacterium]
MTRDAAAIGAGLAPTRDARAIRPGERIHVVGAAGAGASAAALLAAAAGAVVTACDAGGESPYSDALRGAGISLIEGHDAAHVRTDPRPDRLAVTKALTAIDPDHAELAVARAAGIPVEAWQQVIADAAHGRTLVAVAGTHGKSTTSGWLVQLLVDAGMDPSAFVGALLPGEITGGTPATARTGQGRAFVVEADEYAGNFDAYRPAIAVLTSVEWDHPDVFADDAAVHDTFARWLAGIRHGGTIVANIGDAGVAAVIGRPEVAGARLVRVGLDETAADVRGRIVATDPDGTILELEGLPSVEGDAITVRLPTAGRHNAANAMAVAGAAVALGVPTVDIVRGLQTFRGVGRRLERKGEAAGVVVYDDYGHHPTAIRATIAAIRQREPGRRVWAVYEPLTYHRTAALASAFATSLATADAVAIADIWAGRDPDTTITSAAALAESVADSRPGITAVAPGSVDATADWLALNVRDGDAVLVMGGGHSYRIATGLLERLHGDAARR